jgi:hypothetical protein
MPRPVGAGHDSAHAPGRRGAINTEMLKNKIKNNIKNVTRRRVRKMILLRQTEELLVINVSLHQSHRFHLLDAHERS